MKLKKTATTLLTIPIILSAVTSTTLSVYATNTSKNTTSISSNKATPSIKINKKSLKLNVGEIAKLSASILPNNTSFKSIIWQSENTKIATFDRNGMILAKKPGVTTIYAKSKSLDSSNIIYATCTITVTEISNNTCVPSTTNSETEDAYMLVIKNLIGENKPKYVALNIGYDIADNKNFINLIQSYSKTAGFTLLFGNYEGLKSKGYITKDPNSDIYDNYNGGIIISLTVKSNANNKLVIDTGYFCGSLCAEGRTYTLEKVNGSYKIINSEMTWIS